MIKGSINTGTLVTGNLQTGVLGIPTVWTPAQLFTGGEDGDWWDLIVASSLKQLSDGTIDVTAGDVVGYALGQTNGLELIQTSTPLKPLYRGDDGLSFAEDDTGDRLGYSATNSVPTGITTAVRFYRERGGSNERILPFDVGPDFDLSLFSNNDTLVLGGTTLQGDDTATGAWHSLVCRYDGADLDFWVNGVLVSKAFVAALATTFDIELGADIPGAALFLKGKTRNALVISRAITDAEVALQQTWMAQ